MGKLTLIGNTHHNGNWVSMSGIPLNYERVKNILEVVKPAFVSQEIRLFHHLSKFFAPVLDKSISRRELDTIEARILKESSYASEYEAGIIYCRRNNVPLHWTDLYYATEQEVIETDVIKVNQIKSLWADDRDIPAELLEKCPKTGEIRYRNITDRNIFTGRALSALLRKYNPQNGVHICGAGHYNPKIKMPLQTVLSKCSFKPDEIIFEPKISG